MQCIFGGQIRPQPGQLRACGSQLDKNRSKAKKISYCPRHSSQVSIESNQDTEIA